MVASSRVNWAVKNDYSLDIRPFVYFVGISQYTAIIPLHNIKWLVFIRKTECLLRGTDWTIKCNSSWIQPLKGELCKLSGAFAKFRKAIISFVMSVLLSVHLHGTIRLPHYGFSWNLIFEYFFFENMPAKIKVSLKSNDSNGYFAWRPKHIYKRWIKRDQLDVTCFSISLFNAHHVSDVNTSILRMQHHPSQTTT